MLEHTTVICCVLRHDFLCAVDFLNLMVYQIQLSKGMKHSDLVFDQSMMFLGVADIRVSEEKQTPESAITKYSSVLGLVWMHMFILIHMC